MLKNKPDFGGYATKNDIQCADGRTIRKNAFIENDGKTVPLVWAHFHDSPMNVLGHALLENRSDGVYAHCFFNDTEPAQHANKVVKHGDIKMLSIHANGLVQKGKEVVHGIIREVSLVMAGANPGANIVNDSIAHGDGDFYIDDESAIIYTGLSLTHSEAGNDPKKEEPPVEDPKKEEPPVEDPKKEIPPTKEADTVSHAAGEDKTLSEVFDSMSDEQKNVCYAMVSQAINEASGTNPPGDQTATHSNNNEGDLSMKHNVFQNGNKPSAQDVLSHDDMTTILSLAKDKGSLRAVVKNYLAENKECIEHGITSIDTLFPDAKLLTATPTLIERDKGWVDSLMSGISRTPFSRVKSIHADITADQARALGYIKGDEKVEEIFGLLTRTTGPQTVYKTQKLDRDDIVDITDFDVTGWIKVEMRGQLDEEIARAILIGDGRLTTDAHKIKEDCIRPIWKDSDLYTIKAQPDLSLAEDPANPTEDEVARAFIRAAVKARKTYKGSGTPIMFTTEDMLTDCLLLEDLNKRRIYDSITTLATALRVKEIATVPVMEGATRKDTLGKVLSVMAVIMNPADYNVGADKGGAVNMFDDFDIDFNKETYLIETRCSGANKRPYSAIAIEMPAQG